MTMRKRKRVLIKMLVNRTIRRKVLEIKHFLMIPVFVSSLLAGCSTQNGVQQETSPTPKVQPVQATPKISQAQSDADDEAMRKESYRMMDIPLGSVGHLSSPTGDSVLVATKEGAIFGYESRLKRHATDEIAQLVRDEYLFEIDSGTKAEFLENAFSTCRVQIISGKAQGTEVLALARDFQSDVPRKK